MEKAHTEHLAETISFKMIHVAGGEFLMGGNDKEAESREKPVHRVHVDDFYIGQFPVTQAIWQVMKTGKNRSQFQDDARPVERVSWDDCQDFIKALNQQTKLTRPRGHSYRLPTEAEWEYAARGGQQSEGFLYAGSNKLMEVGWYRENSDEETKDLGLLLPNELGIYDMSGNVWEWCWDWYDRNYYETCYKQGIVRNPQGPESGGYRVIRGGSWLDDSRYCRSTTRDYFLPEYRLLNQGFRLVLSPQSVGS